ncbi:MAG: hypothetical protein FJZ64_04640, partial [Chlamydiae bacterium]|nr:hypothetical protein [Chlamydiota bacterium]
MPNETVPDDLLRTWKVQDITKSYFASLQKGSIFYRKHFPHISVQVLKVSPNSFLERLWLAIKTSLIPCRSAKYQEIIVEPLSTDLPTLYLQGSDPYSKLASTVLQRDETPFVSEHLSQGTYHFALEEGNLKLVHASTSPASQHATRAALLAYRNFLKRAFEWRSTPITTAAIRAYGGVFDSSLMTRPQDQFFGYLKETFGIDFDLMLKEGTPLLPDHIYKCNIAAYHIEMPYLESLLFRLNYLMSHAPLPIIPLETIDLFYDYLQENQFDTLFSLKEIRGIYESFLKNSPERKIEKYLKPFQLPSSFHLQPNQGIVRDLMPRAFHQLMQIVMVDSGLVDASSSDKLFTGRTIPHLAISGYKTMGNRQVFDPCRNLAELLHIFPLLRTAHFKRYLELLAHVVSKKALYSVYPSSRHFYTKEWRVGKVIPFPDERGITRWYYIDGYLNDGNGDINYILLPACREYPKLGYTPLIKLYRSTASDREAESSVDSLLADVNPEKVGSLDFDQGDEYEKVYLEKPTMPVWVGYLILGQIDKAIAFFPKLKITPL